MSTPNHIPVLERDVIAQLAPRTGGVYCDGTLGGGGHTLAIARACAPSGRVISIDRDRTAIERMRARLLDDPTLAARITLVHAAFAEMESVLRTLGLQTVDGVVLDLGLSSIQLDTAARGFSFAAAGPIDMRMNADEGVSALELIRSTPQTDLASIIKDFGEERYSKRVAARLKADVREDRLHSTTDLARAIDEAIPARSKRNLRIHPATRTFQALRIAVNRELDQLATFLAAFPDLLAPNGRCVIISFHSLEDRMVKRRFRELAWSSSLPPDLARAAGERVDPVCRILTKRPIVADEEELSRNPRSRSAKLRACQKVSA